MLKAKFPDLPSSHTGKQPEAPRGRPGDGAIIDDGGVSQSEAGWQPERERAVLSRIERSRRVICPKDSRRSGRATTSTHGPEDNLGY